MLDIQLLAFLVVGVVGAILCAVGFFASPFQFYQFWINLPDEGVEKYLKIYTFMPLAEIDALMELHRRQPGERQAQETLARLVTEIVHGPAATAQSAAASDALARSG